MRISDEERARAARFIGGPAGLCGSVLTTSSAEGTDRPAGPSAITRMVYLVAGFRSSINAAYGNGGPVNSCCCHIPPGRFDCIIKNDKLKENEFLRQNKS